MREVQNGETAARLGLGRGLAIGATYVALFVIDRSVKWLARVYQPEQSGWLALRYHLNSDGVFSAPLPSWVLVVLGLVAAAVLVHLVRVNLRQARWRSVLGLMLMLVGGASNLMDRAYLDGVVDMFYVIGGLTFNLADAYLVSGVAIVLSSSRALAVNR